MALLRSVALEGVTDDAAVAAVARAAADPAVVLALGTDFVDPVPRFLTAVLDADVLDPGNGVLGRPLSEALIAFVAS